MSWGPRWFFRGVIHDILHWACNVLHPTSCNLISFAWAPLWSMPPGIQEQGPPSTATTKKTGSHSNSQSHLMVSPVFEYHPMVPRRAWSGKDKSVAGTSTTTPAGWRRRGALAARQHHGGATALELAARLGHSVVAQLCATLRRRGGGAPRRLRLRCQRRERHNCRSSSCVLSRTPRPVERYSA